MTSRSQTQISCLKAQTSKPLSIATSTAIDWKVGEACFVDGSKPGTVAFVGETHFKEGIWAGVILEKGDGKNNGSLNSVTYFQTEENRGIFCRLNKLTRTPKTIDLNKITTTDRAADSADKPKEIGHGRRIGDKVIIKSASNVTKMVGTLRFIGETDFAKGEWAGIELEEKLGKNDGSVADKRYFDCQALYGIFVQASKVQDFEEKKSRLPAYSSRSLVGSNSNVARGTQTLSSIKIPGSDESPSINSMASGVMPDAIEKTGIISKISGKMPHLNLIAAKKQSENKAMLNVSELKHTESKLLDFTKQLEQQFNEILAMSDTISKLTSKNEELTTHLENNKSHIEDLEFQIEEFKLVQVNKEKLIGVVHKSLMKSQQKPEMEGKSNSDQIKDNLEISPLAYMPSSTDLKMELERQKRNWMEEYLLLKLKINSLLKKEPMQEIANTSSSTEIKEELELEQELERQKG